MSLLAQFVGMLLLIGFIGAYFWWILTVLAVAGLVYGAVRAFREIDELEAADRVADAEVVARPISSTPGCWQETTAAHTGTTHPRPSDRSRVIGGGSRPHCSKAQRSSLVRQTGCFYLRVTEPVSVEHPPHRGLDELMFDGGSRHHFHKGSVIEWEFDVRLEHRCPGAESHIDRI